MVLFVRAGLGPFGFVAVVGAAGVVFNEDGPAPLPGLGDGMVVFLLHRECVTPKLLCYEANRYYIGSDSLSWSRMLRLLGGFGCCIIQIYGWYYNW